MLAGNPPRPLPPEWLDTGEYLCVPLWRGRGNAAVVAAHARIDYEDFALVYGHGERWYPYVDAKTTYAVRGQGRDALRMHRRICGLEKGNPRVPDHQNHNGLDNRRDNLIVSTRAQNSRNRRSRKLPSGIFRDRRGQYCVRVGFGAYRDLEEATRVAETAIALRDAWESDRTC